MLTNYTIYLIFIFSFLCQQCTNTKNAQNNNVADKFYNIDFKGCINKEQKFLLSEIADTIEYIVLQTPSDIIITNIRKVIPSGKYLFLEAYGSVYQFFRDGKYIRQVGKIGKGPGEYITASDFFVDINKKEIVILNYPKLLYYSFDGKYIRSLAVSASDVAICDSVIWAAKKTLGVYKHQLVALGNKMDTIASLPNYDFFNEKRHVSFMVSSKLKNPFYYYLNNLYFKGYEDNDTVWEIRGLEFKPHAVLNMGKYKLPLEYRAEYSKQNFLKYAKDYYCIPSMAEDEHFFFITYKSRWQDKLSYSGILYDKKAKQGFVAKDDTTLGITDDILHGPAFWPFYITDEYYISYIEASELITKTDRLLPKSAPFEKLLSEIDENTNQLLPRLSDLN